MASNTPNLGLLKKDPVTDGNDTFNIKTMLNDNWDKIDKAVKDVQDGLADIKIPDASLTQKGIVQLSNATDGTRENVAATEKAIKSAYDQGKVAQDNLTTHLASTTHKQVSGVTQSGRFSSAEGLNTTASGDYSHAEGYQTIASGSRSHAEGYLTKASNSDSHAEGYNTEASGDTAHAEGGNTKARGMYSHAEGYQTIAGGDYSHVEGRNTFAMGYVSHAEGNKTIATNSYTGIVKSQDNANRTLFLSLDGYIFEAVFKPGDFVWAVCEDREISPYKVKIVSSDSTKKNCNSRK